MSQPPTSVLSTRFGPHPEDWKGTTGSTRWVAGSQKEEDEENLKRKHQTSRPAPTQPSNTCPSFCGIPSAGRGGGEAKIQTRWQIFRTLLREEGLREGRGERGGGGITGEGGQVGWRLGKKLWNHSIQSLSPAPTGRHAAASHSSPSIGAGYWLHHVPAKTCERSRAKRENRNRDDNGEERERGREGEGTRMRGGG